MKNKEYSKKIVYWTGIIFVSQLICGIVFSGLSLDSSIFMYTIPTTGGVFGAGIVFYLNKSKLENIIKIKISYTKFKLSASRLIPPEAMEEIDNEFMTLENSLNNKIDSTMDSAISEDINLDI